MIGRLGRRVWYLLNRRRLQEELRREMEAHRALMGEPARFGNTLRLREEAADVWEWQWLDHLARDVRHGVISLSRTRGFTATVVLSLALGFALAASTSAIVNAYLVQPLPYANPERLYHVRYAPFGPWEPRGLSSLDWTEVSDVVEFPVVARGDTFYLDDAGRATTARALRVGRGFVEGLGVRAVLGRTLGAEDFGAAGERPAVMGHALWRDRYGSDPGVVGRTLRVESEAGRGEAAFLRIVGVLPPDFYFGRNSSEQVDFLLPLAVPATAYMARIRAGIPASFAEQRLTEAVRRMGAEVPPDWTGVHFESVRERYVADLRPVLLGLTGATSLVLLIVCANVGVLVLLRTMRRQKELAVRASLGSSRRGLARMLVTETALLCGAALGLGVMVTRALTGVVAPLIETQLGKPAPRGAEAIAVDGTVLLIVGVIGVLVAFALALLPLAMPWQERLAEALRTEGTRATDGPTARRLRAGLVAFEMAGTLVLVIASGLLIRSVVTMARTDLGFDADALVRGRIVLRAAAYPTPESFFQYYEAFRARLAQVTNAQVVFATWPPFAAFPDATVEIDSAGGSNATTGAISVGGGYFSTLGVLMRAGREITAEDVASGAPIAIVSESLARRLSPDAGVVGRRVRVIQATPNGPTAGPWRAVVGVAGDVRQGYDDRVVDDIYTPIQRSGFGRYASFYVRPGGPVEATVDAARRVATELDARAVVSPIGPVADEDRQIAGASVLMKLLAAFTAITAIIAVVGIYGVTAYGVQQRQREIAVRMALGASQAAVLRLFLGEAGWVLAGGLLCGLVGALAAGRLLGSQLTAVGVLDLPTLAISAALLGVVGVLATWWPARRGARQNPLGALKEG